MRSPAPFLLTLFLPCLSLAAQEKFTLRYALKQGQTTWAQLTQEMTQRMSREGQKDVNTTMSTSMWMETKTAEVGDDFASLESRYARITVKGDGPGLKIDYDSEVEGSNPGPMRAVADLAGKSAKMRVDPMGKLVEFSMPEGLEGQMEKIGPSLKQTFEQSLTTWPKDATRIGESWTSNLDMPMGAMGTMKATITNKLVAMKDQVATVEQTMAMDTSGLKLPGTVKLEVTKAAGVSKISLASTVPIEGTMDLEMKFDGGKDAPTMTMTQRMIMKQVEAPAPKKPAEAPKAVDGK